MSTDVQELLRLSDAIGEVKSRGLAPGDVEQLESYYYDPPRSSADTHGGPTPCVICLDPFTGGQLIRALPCRHRYHAACVDRWLTVRTCLLADVLQVGPSLVDRWLTVRTCLLAAVLQVGPSLVHRWLTVRTCFLADVLQVGPSLVDRWLTVRTCLLAAVLQVGASLVDQFGR